MRRISIAVVMTALLGCLGASAYAASTTVSGTGDIEKMTVNNAQRAVKVKLVGLEGPCDAHYFKVVLYWGTKRAYQVDAGCYPGGQWASSLVYLSNRSKPESGKLVECPKLRVVYVEDKGFWRIRAPRSCMPRAADRLRARSEGRDYTSTMGGEAGPTRRLARG